MMSNMRVPIDDGKVSVMGGLFDSKLTWQVPDRTTRYVSHILLLPLTKRSRIIGLFTFHSLS